jgi:uncharacterized protein YjiS (DUF1127 family)
MIDSEISPMQAGHVWRRWRSSAIGLIFYEIACWIHDEIRRSAAIGELSRLNDHYLADVDINRNDIESIVDTMVKCLRENQNGTCDQDDATIQQRRALGRLMLDSGNSTPRRRISKGVH